MGHGGRTVARHEGVEDGDRSVMVPQAFESLQASLSIGPYDG